MEKTLKGIAVNYEKLHRLKMIETILHEMHSYVHDVVDSIEDIFACSDDGCCDIEDYIIENVVNNTRENIATLGCILGKDHMSTIYTKIV